MIVALLLSAEKPNVTLDVVKGVGKGKLFVNWTVSDGNAPLNRYYVQVSFPKCLGSQNSLMPP